MKTDHAQVLPFLLKNTEYFNIFVDQWIRIANHDLTHSKEEVLKEHLADQTQ